MKDKTRIFYSPAYNSTLHAFDTTRKATLLADYLTNQHSDEIAIVEPDMLTRDQLLTCHDAKYVDAVATGRPELLARSNGFQWCPNMYNATRSSNGGVLAAAVTATKYGISGSLSSGLHHAHAEYGGGFCTFNGLAIAAKHITRQFDARVLIVDFDAHYGDGTHALIAGDDSIEMIDVSTSDFAAVRSRSNGYGFQYLRRCCELLNDVDVTRFDLVLYNAGMDPYEGCSIGGLNGVTLSCLAERDRYVFTQCAKNSVPVAFCLAGGYSGERFTPEQLTIAHATTCLIAHDTRTEYWS